MATVRVWTGAETKALRRALRLSIRDFAAHLDVGARTVARWEARGAGITLAPDSQGLLDTAFSRVSGDVKQRFTNELAAHAGDDALVAQDVGPPPSLESTVQLPVLVDGQPMLVPLATYVSARGLGSFLAGCTGVQPKHVPLAKADAMSPLDRRAFLKASVGTTLWTALDPDQQAHVGAALEAPARNLDGSVVEYFRRQLASYMAEDGNTGPSKTLPMVLSLVTAIEQCACEVPADLRCQLLALAARGAEFLGWLYRDLHDLLRGGFWYDRATEWAQEAGDLPMQGYVLLKKSQMAYDERDAVRVLTLAQAAEQGPWQLPPRVKAEVTQQAARGLAMTGEPMPLVEQKLEDARRLMVTAGTGEPDDQLGAYYNEGTLTLRTASCYIEAGKPRQAAELYNQVLQADLLSRRDRGYFMARMASSLALAGEPDEAASIGLGAAELAGATTSQRTKRELGRTLSTLQPWSGRPGPKQLREVLLG